LLLRLCHCIRLKFHHWSLLATQQFSRGYLCYIKYLQVQVLNYNGHSAYLRLQYTNNIVTGGDMCFLYV
jgi:hypothetical protein